MKTAKEALATHLGMDMAELGEYRYQPGRFTKAVYAVSDGYYCATKTALPRRVRKSEADIDWVEVKDPYVNRYGWRIYRDRQ